MIVACILWLVFISYYIIIYNSLYQQRPLKKTTSFDEQTHQTNHQNGIYKSYKQMIKQPITELWIFKMIKNQVQKSIRQFFQYY